MLVVYKRISSSIWGGSRGIGPLCMHDQKWPCSEVCSAHAQTESGAISTLVGPFSPEVTKTYLFPPYFLFPVLFSRTFLPPLPYFLLPVHSPRTFSSRISSRKFFHRTFFPVIFFRIFSPYYFPPILFFPYFFSYIFSRNFFPLFFFVLIFPYYF